MIVTEALIIDGRECVKTYSDAGVKIRGGFPDGDYDEAVDPKDSDRTYTETDIPIEGEDTAEEILNILMGVGE
ncbi:MAG: hypothetical protein J6T26_09905 [Firmicutes bacterium]|nr:hypothetical protein [Bacillota bacterium]